MSERNIRETKELYQNILALCEKLPLGYCAGTLKSDAEKILRVIEIEELYKIKIHFDCHSYDNCYNLADHMSFGKWGKKYQRTISWLDNGEQPEDEWLLCISFPTGAYIFGSSSNNDYPTEFFKQFWEELKTYRPKYIDTNNKSLYFSTENAYLINNEFDGIMRKYRELNKKDFEKRKIVKLQKEIADLEAKQCVK